MKVAPWSVRGAETRGRTLRGMEVNCSKFSNGWILPLIEIEARKRMVAGAIEGGKVGILEKATGKPVRNSAQGLAPQKSRAVAAKLVGVSGHSIQIGKAVLAKAPEVFELMEKGKITVNAATLKAEEVFAVEAKKRIEQGRSKTKLDERMEKMDLAPQNSAEGPDRHSRESRDKAANLIGASRRKCPRARLCSENIVRKSIERQTSILEVHVTIWLNGYM